MSLKNKYSGAVYLSPMLSDQELQCIKDIIQIIKEKNAKTLLTSYLQAPLTSLQIYQIYQIANNCYILEKDKILFNEQFYQSAAKPLLEKLCFFFFEEQILFKLKQIPTQPHTMSGTVYGSNENNEKWVYEIENNKIYNLENEQKNFRPRFRKELFSNLDELVILRSEVKVTNSISKKIMKI